MARTTSRADCTASSPRPTASTCWGWGRATASVRHGRERPIALGAPVGVLATSNRSEEHTSELQSIKRITYAVFCFKKKTLHNAPTAAVYHRMLQLLRRFV